MSESAEATGVEAWRAWCAALPLDLAVHAGEDGSAGDGSAELLARMPEVLQGALEEVIAREVLHPLQEALMETRMLDVSASVESVALMGALGAFNVMPARLQVLAERWWATTVLATPEPLGWVAQQWGIDLGAVSVAGLSDNQLAAMQRQLLALFDGVMASEFDEELVTALATLQQVVLVEQEMRRQDRERGSNDG